MDSRSTYSLSVLAPLNDGFGEPRTEVIARLKEFILSFQIDGVYIYRDQIRDNVLVRRYYCDVDIAHLISYSEELAHKLSTDPSGTIPLFETALRQCTQRIVYPQKPDVDLPQHQLMLHSSIDHISIRDLTADNVSALVRIPGIVIGASTLSSKATALAIQCRNCQHTEKLGIEGGFQGVSLPRICGRKKVPGQDEGDKCPLDPYFVVHEESQFQDQQIIKLQEAPDQVPVGELPRHILISADRYLANRVVPGSRCTVMGVYSIYQQNKNNKASAVAIRNPYLRAVGITTDVDHGTGSNTTHFTEEEIQEFEELSRSPDLYEKLARSIAPSIYGNADIKKAIACLLMGGSKKILPDGMKLRGDINVLLLGDPGTAKSQLLKFVEKVAPIAIYTSGKGSSAAGLTASVQRDVQSREFYLEGGAMVLADGGVVCIDEFDKMRDEDRVAIHEAMEQQTISIAKAGITTILNARTSVLAAANPIFGRYDDLKSPGENIDFQTTILSRFDMIFIVRDDHNQKRDETIARHVMGIHMGNGANNVSAEDQITPDIPVEKMKRYITFCKSRCAPRLSKEATEKLSSHFVTIRAQTARHERGANMKSSIPITIRQLEAIIRITESLAKLTLSPIADESHVDEAIRLFLASTMDAVTHERSAYNTSGMGAGGGNTDLMAEVGKLEEELRKRLPIGWSASLAKLKGEFCAGRGYSEAALGRCLGIMQRRESIRMRGGGGVVWRCGV
ncbi:minichromosome maintenance protein 5 [Knufia obscura]|uniref:DNA replication licensing factor MCM5 n=1 Tax=Knufia obscura TaxID=1635080 RepID=A0ABR0RAA1_9EURO|nr:minichromosome maintenance protein 5 [Knufia obscura]